jgi:hypothetical protein
MPPRILFASCIVLASSAWLPHALLGLNLTEEAGPYSKAFFDSAFPPLGRIVILPATLQIVSPCPQFPDANGNGCTNCSVAFDPDSRFFSFPVTADIHPDDPIAVVQQYTTNVGPELLTPGATVYVPPRDCRPPLILSYGGALVNECTTTPFVRPYFPASSWCFTPSFSTHILRLDSLDWIHVSANSTGPESLSPIPLNNTGLFGLGVFLAYDAAADRILLAGTLPSSALLVLSAFYAILSSLCARIRPSAITDDLSCFRCRRVQPH